MTLSRWLNQITQRIELDSRRPRSRREQMLQDPYYRFRSIAEVQEAAALGVTIDANRATVDDWLRLPGLSIHQAKLLHGLSQGGVQFHCLEDVAAALDVPVAHLQPLASILRFYYYDPDGVEAIQTLNVNQASIAQLTKVPGVDLFLARAIVEQRSAHGPYRNLVDLQRRLSLPATLTAELMHYLHFSG
ncbi:ComEA family DNA-binding protein [Trichothermofontia sp.]